MARHCLATTIIRNGTRYSAYLAFSPHAVRRAVAAQSRKGSALVKMMRGKGKVRLYFANGESIWFEAVRVK